VNTPYFNHTIICTARSLRTGQTFRVGRPCCLASVDDPCEAIAAQQHGGSFSHH
jgi:hypothetical protein